VELPNHPSAASLMPLNQRNARRFVDSFTPLISAQLSRFRLPHDLLQDAVQETLVRCLRGLKHFRGEAQLSTWVYRIAYREGLRAQEKLQRDRSRAVSLSPLAEPADAATTYSPSFAAEQQDEVLRVRTAMETLPNEQRLVLGYHYLDGLSVHEIALLMSARPNTVKSWLKRGRDSLKSTLAAPSPEDSA